MDTRDLTGEKPHPELLLYLRNDLLLGLNELLDYTKQLRIGPNNQYGIISRIVAMRDDLAEVCGKRSSGTGEHSNFTVYHYGKLFQSGIEGMANDT